MRKKMGECTVISVSTVRRLAKASGADRMIILAEYPDGTVGYASYGATKALCRETKSMADRAFAAVWPDAE